MATRLFSDYSHLLVRDDVRHLVKSFKNSSLDCEHFSSVRFQTVILPCCIDMLDLSESYQDPVSVVNLSFAKMTIDHGVVLKQMNEKMGPCSLRGSSEHCLYFIITWMLSLKRHN